MGTGHAYIINNVVCPYFPHGRPVQQSIRNVTRRHNKIRRLVLSENHRIEISANEKHHLTTAHASMTFRVAGQTLSAHLKKATAQDDGARFGLMLHQHAPKGTTTL